VRVSDHGAEGRNYTIGEAVGFDHERRQAGEQDAAKGEGERHPVASWERLPEGK